MGSTQNVRLADTLERLHTRRGRERKAAAHISAAGLLAKGLHFEGVPEREREGQERYRETVGGGESECILERTGEEKWQMMERERGSNAQGLQPSPER